MISHDISVSRRKIFGLSLATKPKLYSSFHLSISTRPCRIQRTRPSSAPARMPGLYQGKITSRYEIPAVSTIRAGLRQAATRAPDGRPGAPSGWRLMAFSMAPSAAVRLIFHDLAYPLVVRQRLASGEKKCPSESSRSRGRYLLCPEKLRCHSRQAQSRPQSKHFRKLVFFCCCSIT